MRADSPRTGWTSLVLALALLSAGCASLPPPGHGMNLRYAPREAGGTALAEGPERLSPRGGSRDAVAGVGTEHETEEARQRALAAHLALLGAVGDVSGTTRRISGELSRLKASHAGIVGKSAGLFNRYIDYGQRHLRWIDAELAAATRLTTAASEVEDPDMQLALLRLAGPRLEAAMLGSLLLAAWVDFLSLYDAAFKQGYGSVETPLMNTERRRKLLEPSMKALSSLEPGQVEAAAKDLPALMGHLSDEFTSTAENIRVSMKRLEQVLVVTQLIETATLLSAMRFSLPPLAPSAPATFGVGLMLGGDGVMLGTRLVVSAEWVEMMRRLVRAGVLSLPAVSSAVRIQAGQVMMAESHDDLPKGVRDALGDGPEVRAMRETGRTGAGMAEPPEHHVLPREFREWFEKRGFTGEMSIDQFCVRMEQAGHQAIHGGGNWRLGRTWPGEWNRMIMKTLRNAEVETGRMLTRSEILSLVAQRMKDYSISLHFTSWRGR